MQSSAETINGHNGSMRDSNLRVGVIRSFGSGLRLCRERKAFSAHHVAAHVNVSMETLAKWEQDKDVPSSQKLKRLIGMMRQLQYFRQYIPDHKRKAADLAEAAEEKRAKLEEEKKAKQAAFSLPAPTPPPPPLPAPIGPIASLHPGMSFGDAVLACRAARELAQGTAAKLMGVTGTCLGNIERGITTPSPLTYRSLVRAYPELRRLPPPIMKGGGGCIVEPLPDEEPPRPAVSSPPIPTDAATFVSLARAPAAVAPPPAEPTAPVRVEKVETLDSVEELGRAYARAIVQEQLATAFYEEAFAAADAADKKKVAAVEAREELHRKLVSAAGKRAA